MVEGGKEEDGDDEGTFRRRRRKLRTATSAMEKAIDLSLDNRGSYARKKQQRRRKIRTFMLATEEEDWTFRSIAEDAATDLKLYRES